MKLRSIFLLFLCVLIYTSVSAQDLSEQIRFNLEQAPEEGKLNLSGVPIQKTGETFRFYADRNFTPVWSENGLLNELAYEMRFEIRQAKYDGLNPEAYHLGIIETFFEAFESNQKSGVSNSLTDLAELELFLSDAYFLLASHLDRGKVDPSRLKVSWDIPRKPQTANYADLLNESIQSQSIREGLEKLYPEYPAYRKGREVIRELEEKAKGDDLNWKPLKTDKSIKVGESNSQIPTVRERLGFWGYLGENMELESRDYDSLLFESVKNYQLAKGLEADGILGKLTLSALNESPVDLMQKAAINLERLRWIPNSFFQSDLILINIPNFRLDYRSPTDTIFSTRVIVGTYKNQSPVFTAAMRYIVFSPYWNIPPSIARNEVIPAIRRNSDYLSRNHMEVVTGSGTVVPNSQINWAQRPFPYLIRQKPGTFNSLGLVKFMFPNRYNVYLHDTPGKHLFDREVRTFSHGCIRMQDPFQFAQILLDDMEEWTSENIEEAMNQGKEQIVNLQKNIPVLIVYLTFWADTNGQPHFRPDIYNRDEELRSLLNF
ncbi:L,D-transpeptidase family protein [Algoriphagus sp. CAU 1675]|uniref:L,D-transpeptidase family protein n=1 Tax=Algoriphagus sp. CAU 1675 TaxID=3032597 RepID=UPI0023D9B7AF|nr:L,D-transpeptidase family protein [Algoriphagus sp. CAU 1675]MDF2158470.1 L,D-transpeptidase family protein [Algoriphagus sp. CAU 1675]